MMQSNITRRLSRQRDLVMSDSVSVSGSAAWRLCAKGAGEGLKSKRMVYQLVPASIEDEAWLERLRRDVYQELFTATFGSWDETRHARQFGECLNRGGISIIEVDGARVGMIQLFDQSDAVEVGEIQIQPSHQNQEIGSRVLKDTIAQVHGQRRKVLLLSL